ncbi:MAG: AmmeMemoRadiSam system protein B [Candidatus Helarchaeota archaeon]
MIRRAAVAGQFYRGDPTSLKKSIEKCFLDKSVGPGNLPMNVERHGKKEIIAVISPHAGYIYSGPVAAHGFLELYKDRIKPPDTIIIIGPNHHGGVPIATMVEGAWETPFGTIDIDSEIAQSLIQKNNKIQDDKYSHSYEHSIEVQLPFLQYLYDNDFQFVPICMLYHNFKNCTIVGETVASIILQYSDKDILIVASTDFTHFEPHDIAKVKDRKAISAIEKLDAQLLFNTVNNERISMCGVDPVTATIIASNKLNAKKAQFLKWASSGDVTNDKYRVVGYGSIVILK